MKFPGSGAATSHQRYTGARRGGGTRGGVPEGGRSSVTQTAQARAKRPFKLSGEALKLMSPRWGILALGFVLMAVNRVAAFVVPASSKYLFDSVIDKHNIHLLHLLVFAVILATLVQGATSYSLTQLLSKSSQRMITELRVKVQAHIGRLPVAYYDANKSGVLVSRIMSDVEGIRNLVGTGSIDFVLGFMTAVIGLAYLLRASVSMTLAAIIAVLIFGLCLGHALTK